MEKILKKYSLKMIVILGLLLGILLWINGPTHTVSAQTPPIPTPTPAPPIPPPPPPPSTMPISEPIPVDPFPFEPAPPIPFPGGGCSGEPTEEGSSIIGSVVDPDGNLVANSYMEIYDSSSEVWCYDVFTDENGEFHVYGLTAGTWILSAQAPWNESGTQDYFPSQKVEAEVSEEAGPMALVTPLQLSGPQATGQVLMPDGTPASNGNVNLYTPPLEGQACADVTDEDFVFHSSYGFTYMDGMFKVGGLAAGTYCIQVMAPWDQGTLGAPAVSQLTLSSESSETIDLGTFQLAAPVKTIEVIVSYTKNDGTTAGLADVNVGIDSQGMGGYVDGLTDSDGTYTVQVSGGRWHVSVFPGHESSISRFQNSDEPQIVTFADDETEEIQRVTFEVELPTSSMQARIVTSDGEPVPANNAAMEEMGYYGGINININAIGDNWNNASTTANADGEFQFFLPAGEYEMTIYVDTYLYPEYYGPDPQTFTLAENEALDLGDIELVQIDSSVTGRLVGVDGGALPSPSPIDVEFGWFEDEYSGISVNAYNDQHRAHQEIDASGSFNLPLPPGEYTLEFYLETFLYSGIFAPAPQVIQTTEGETLDLGDISLQPAQISGNLQTADGESVGYANYQIYEASVDCVNNYSERSFYGAADESGQFSMGGLPAGEYCLRVDTYWGMGGLFAPQPVRFTIEEGAETLDLGAIAYQGPNKTIQGVVLSDDGEGVPNVMLNAYLRNGEYGWAETTTDADGIFTLEVIGGVWDVNIFSGSHEEYPVATEQAWFSENTHQVVTFAQDETEETENVEFLVQIADSTIIGRIVAPDGTPLSMDNAMDNPIDEMAEEDMYGYPGDYGYSALSVNAYSRSGYGNSATVGDDGTFSISVIGGNYEFSIHVDEYMYPNYYAPEMPSIRVEESGTADLGDILLGEKNSTIQGQALTPDGTGIANVSVAAYSNNGWANTTTDEQGAYTMMVRAGDWEVSVQSYMDPTESTGYFLLNTTQQASVAENESVTVDFAAEGAAGNILGAIVDSDGLPITDLDIMAYARRVSDVDEGVSEVVAAARDLSVPAPTPAPAPYPEPYPEPFGDYSGDYGYYYGYDVVAQSMSEQGQFTLSVPSGVYEVGLYLPYNSDYVFAGEVGTSVTETTADEAPGAVADAVIRASSRGQVAQANAVGEQRVTMSVAPDGTVEDVTVQLVLLRNDATISGTLLDSNGEAVTGVGGEVYGWMDGPSSSRQSAKIDPETGSYELTVAGGTWYLEYNVDSDAYLNYGGGESLSVAVESKGSAQQDITLRDLDGVIRGTVTDPEGNPIRWGYVWADVAPSVADDPDAFFYHSASAEVINGEFELQVISGLTYAFNASSDDNYVQPATQVVIPEADSSTVVDLQFRTTDGVISGTLTALIDDVVQPSMAGHVYGWSDDGQYANVEADEEGNFSFEVASGSIWYLGASWWPAGSGVFYNTAEEVAVDLTESANSTAELVLTAQDYPMPPMIAEPFMADEAAAYTLEDGTQIEIPAGAISLDNGTDAPSAPIAEAPAAPEPAPAPAPAAPPAFESPITDDDAAEDAASEEGDEAADDGGNAVQAQEARINVAPMVEDMPCTVTACPVGYGYNVAVYDNASGEQVVRNFNESVKMTFHYTDEELAEADEDSIAPAYFSSTSNTWTRLESFTQDTEANQIVAEISHPGRWALVTAANVEIRTPTALPTADEEFKHRIFLPILMK